MSEPLEIATPGGPARAHLRAPEPGGTRRGALLLGHGAGGSVDAPDLRRVTREATALGLLVVLVEQPYRVAGKRSTPRPPVLDEAWTAVVGALRAGPLGDLPFVAGGRSSGARVACRTAADTGAVGVLCLAFPLLPPQRAAAAAPPPSRLPELDGVKVPALVIQGANDRFGMPPARRGRQVVEVRGDHGLKSDLDAVGAAARAWLRRLAALKGSDPS